MTNRILALDDEPHMLKLLERIISEKTPYKISTLGNPLEIYSVLENQQYDIIITDLKMPGLDGLDILRFVKEQELDLEVIIMTAFGSLETAQEALSEGVFDYITKPFKKEQIIYTLDRAFRCLDLKRKSKKVLDIMDIMPYQKAVEAFQRQFILRLAAGRGADNAELARISGIPADKISQVLNESDGGQHESE
jgi:YesN/AraC family two-component response regulator